MCETPHLFLTVGSIAFARDVLYALEDEVWCSVQM